MLQLSKMVTEGCCMGQSGDPAASLSPEMRNFLRWAGLICSCLGMMVTSSVASFNSYAHDVKRMFDLSQSQGR